MDIFNTFPTTITHLEECTAHDENPFLNTITFNSKTVLKKVKRNDNVPENILNDDKELNKIGFGIGKTKEKQKANFLLLYLDDFIPFENLSNSTLRVVFYMLKYKVGLNQDIIVVSVKELESKMNLSRPSITKAFIELINNNIIAKRDANVWWINPTYFYSGNRLNIRTK